jgi:predicted transcriptional regulator
VIEQSRPGGTVSEEDLEAASTQLQTPAIFRTLGQREREVMAILCTQESASVQQVSEQLSSNLAYTTVMTTLDRLFRKGFLERRKKDRAYIYSAALTSREIEGQRAAGLVRKFFADSGESPEVLLSCLVDAVHRYDTKLLDQLEDKIRFARKQQAQSNLKTEEDS